MLQLVTAKNIPISKAGRPKSGINCGSSLRIAEIAPIQPIKKKHNAMHSKSQIGLSVNFGKMKRETITGRKLTKAKYP